MHVLFNNCYANYGATNAIEFAQMLLDLEAAEQPDGRSRGDDGADDRRHAARMGVPLLSRLPPSDDGLHFPNSFPPGPTIRSACWIRASSASGMPRGVVRRMSFFVRRGSPPARSRR